VFSVKASGILPSRSITALTVGCFESSTTGMLTIGKVASDASAEI